VPEIAVSWVIAPEVVVAWAQAAIGAECAVTVAGVPRRKQSGRRGSTSSAGGPRPLAGGLGWARTEPGPDGEWIVRNVPGSQATKSYRCPGCDHVIPPGMSHVVTWPAQEYGTVEDRRHWHNGCWAARGRRGPTSRRW
jgi:hypothetical protein